MKRGRQAGADLLRPTTEVSRHENVRLLALVRELRRQLAAERKLRHQLKMKILAVLREEGAAKPAAPKPSRARQSMAYS
jgi:hypothetical protein